MNILQIDSVCLTVSLFPFLEYSEHVSLAVTCTTMRLAGRVGVNEPWPFMVKLPVLDEADTNKFLNAMPLAKCIWVQWWDTDAFQSVYHRTNGGELKIDGLRVMDDDDLQYIGCRELTCLTVNGCGITDDGLAELARSPLEKLDLSCTDITDDGL